MMIRTRGRRLVSRLEALERIYDTRGPRVFRVIFEYGGEPTIVTIYRDENRTEIIEPPPPDDDPDEFFGASESTEQQHLGPALPPDDETISDPDSQAHPSVALGPNRIVTDKVQLRQKMCKQSRERKSAVRASPSHGPFESPRRFLKIGSCPRIAKTSGHHLCSQHRDRHSLRFRSVGARHAVPTLRPAIETILTPAEPRASASGPVMSCDPPKPASYKRDPAPPQNRAANASERPYCSPNYERFSSPTEPRGPMAAAHGSLKPSGHGPCSRRRDRRPILLWRTLSVRRVETLLDAWGRFNDARPNKTNLAEPQCKQQLPRPRKRCPNRQRAVGVGCWRDWRKHPLLAMAETQQPKKDFFISRNGADAAWAEWIAWQLEKEEGTRRCLGL